MLDHIYKQYLMIKAYTLFHINYKMNCEYMICNDLNKEYKLYQQHMKSQVMVDDALRYINSIHLYILYNTEYLSIMNILQDNNRRVDNVD